MLKTQMKGTGLTFLNQINGRTHPISTIPNRTLSTVDTINKPKYKKSKKHKDPITE